MKYISTLQRGDSRVKTVGFSKCIVHGLASDGGLFVPAAFPSFRIDDFDGLKTFPDIAERVLAPFLRGDPQAQHLRAACRKAFNFPLPLTHLPSHAPSDENTSVLELFHGPTAAFKDFGARFLAEMVAKIPSTARRTVLVATSGDTGGAVAAAFFRRRGIRVVILFPEGKISPRQEKQLTAWGANIRAFAVRGDFDDCQRMVKEAFADSRLARRHRFLSANSINVGRLLPQVAYYAAASLWYRREMRATPSFIVPSGNLGNAVGALWAKHVGFPIGKIVMATNANATVPEYLRTGAWRPRATIATLANAMDVGNPSNMERVLALYPTLASLKRDVDAISVSDEEIRRTIAAGPARWGQVWDPHTAAAVFAREKIGGSHTVIVATAHPAKFEAIIEPLVGRTIGVPPALAAILKRPSREIRIEPALEALRSALD